MGRNKKMKTREGSLLVLVVGHAEATGPSQRM